MTTNSPNFPQTLLEAIAYFANADTAHAFMVELRWGAGPVCCPRCGCDKTTFISTRRTWECKSATSHPQRQFSVKTGTIMEESPLSLDKWLATIWLIANAKNGISSYEVHRALGVTQKTGWFLLHRIRLAMQTGTFEKLKGSVEADETYIGGRGANMHASRKKRALKGGRGMVGKSIVMGLLERGGNVIVKQVPNSRRVSVQAEVRAKVEPGSAVYTDALASYTGLSDEYIHGVIDHAVEYVNGLIHTNGLENFWSLLKRTLKGTYVSVDPEHLMRYLDEQTFRFNKRKLDDAGRFLLVMFQTLGRRLTYKQLTANPQPA